jgi:hypothetical protein
MKRLAIAVLLVAACQNTDDVEPTPDAAVDPDPLAVTMSPSPGSLDDLHERIIAKRCSGQPGLCHNGQFEPNLSTPGLTYAYVVDRPAIEKPTLLRVRAGNSAQSLFIDKIRNRNGVATQMPLGAEPLPEADIAAIEKWIDDGALRAPDAAAAPKLNNPPKRPQIAIFNATGTRLDGVGPVTISPNTTLVLRHTVQDFETADSAIPFAALVLTAQDGRNVVLTTSANDPHVGPTTYDPTGPTLPSGDQLNFRRTWVIGSSIELYDPVSKLKESKPAGGHTISILCAYIDSPTMGIAALDSAASTIKIQ